VIGFHPKWLNKKDNKASIYVLFSLARHDRLNNYDNKLKKRGVRVVTIDINEIRQLFE
jgi:ACT domain-containing protein